MKQRETGRTGMTLAEIMLVVVLIGILSALLVPAVLSALRSRENTECSRKLLLAVQAFELYAAERGSYPASAAAGEVPPEMAGYYFPYFKIDWWEDPSELGGSWTWTSGSRISVSITGPNRTVEQMTEFDRLIDDGDLQTGQFRRDGGRYHFILGE